MSRGIADHLSEPNVFVTSRASSSTDFCWSAFTECAFIRPYDRLINLQDDKVVNFAQKKNCSLSTWGNNTSFHKCGGDVYDSNALHFV